MFLFKMFSFEAKFNFGSPWPWIPPGLFRSGSSIYC